MNQLTFLTLIPPDKEDPEDVMRELSRSCRDCRLGVVVHPSNRGVIWRGSLKGRIAVVGEAPGDQETEQGRPLVGPSGRLWERWASFLGLDTKMDCFLTNVVQCFTGSTVIEEGGASKVYRRYYRGPGVSVRTEGNVLTGTPNHPALTLRGWVPLGELRQGDYLVRSHIRRKEPTISPYEHNRPTRFDEVFSSFSERGIIQRVVGGRSDFHGDGSNSYVDIVGANRLLRLDQVTPGFQLFGKLPFVFTDHCAASKAAMRASYGSFEKRGFSFRPSGSSSIGFPSNLSTIGERSSFVPGFVAFANVSNGDASPTELSKYRSRSHTDSLGEAFHALSGEIQSAQVIEIKAVNLSEHVYNLETPSNMYVAEGFVVSNCQPDKVPNKDDGGVHQRAPHQDELDACFGPRCLRILRAMPNLEVVITLGWVAASAFLGGEAKSKTHENMWFKSTLLPGIAFYCLVHPSYILREPTTDKTQKVQEGLKRFREEYLLKNKDVLAIVRQMEAEII